MNLFLTKHRKKLTFPKGWFTMKLNKKYAYQNNNMLYYSIHQEVINSVLSNFFHKSTLDKHFDKFNEIIKRK